MNNTTTYINRYRDKIVFTQEGDLVTMTGYNPEWLGCAYDNDYDEAYNEYLSTFTYSSNPNHYKDNNPSLGPKDRKEFIDYLFSYDFELKEYKCPKKYRDLCKSTDTIINVDPSGGPYISIGTDLNEFFNDGLKRIVESIDIQPSQIIFKIK